MKAKLGRGNGFRGVLSYVFGAEKDAELIGGTMSGSSPREMAKEFGVIRRRKDCKNPVFHASLSLPSGERLPAEKWDQIASEFLAGLGMDPATHLYAVVRHQDTDHDHIHVIACRIGLDNRIWHGQRDVLKAIKLTETLEKKHNLTITPTLDASNSPAVAKPLSGAEIQMGARTGKPPPRLVLQEAIREAVKGRPSASAFAQRLANAGISVRPALGKSGTLSGFSFGYQGVNFKGSQLGKNFGWAGLQRQGVHFDQNRDFAPLSQVLAASRDADRSQKKEGSRPEKKSGNADQEKQEKSKMGVTKMAEKNNQDGLIEDNTSAKIKAENEKRHAADRRETELLETKRKKEADEKASKATAAAVAAMQQSQQSQPQGMPDIGQYDGMDEAPDDDYPDDPIFWPLTPTALRELEAAAREHDEEVEWAIKEEEEEKKNKQRWAVYKKRWEQGDDGSARDMTRAEKKSEDKHRLETGTLQGRLNAAKEIASRNILKYYEFDNDDDWEDALFYQERIDNAVTKLEAEIAAQPAPVAQTAAVIGAKITDAQRLEWERDGRRMMAEMEQKGIVHGVYWHREAAFCGGPDGQKMKFAADHAVANAPLTAGAAAVMAEHARRLGWKKVYIKGTSPENALRQAAAASVRGLSYKMVSPYKGLELPQSYLDEAKRYLATAKANANDNANSISIAPDPVPEPTPKVADPGSVASMPTPPKQKFTPPIKPTIADVAEGRAALAQMGFDKAALAAAERSGIINSSSGIPKMIGRDHAGNVASCAQVVDSKAWRPAPYSDTSAPPIIAGDTRRVWIATTPSEALAVASLASIKGEKLPTVIMAGPVDQGQAWLTDDVKRILEKAEAVTVATTWHGPGEQHERIEAMTEERRRAIETALDTSPHVDVYEPRSDSVLGDYRAAVAAADTSSVTATMTAGVRR